MKRSVTKFCEQAISALSKLPYFRITNVIPCTQRFFYNHNILYPTQSKLPYEKVDYIKKNSVVVDPGCGPGGGTFYIQQECAPKSITGVDPVAEQVGRARKFLKESNIFDKSTVQFLEGSADHDVHCSTYTIIDLLEALNTMKDVSITSIGGRVFPGFRSRLVNVGL